MALVEGSVIIILYIVVVILVFKLVRSIIKTVLVGLLLMLAIVGVAGFLVVSDANDLRHNFMNSSKAIYLSEGDDLLAGFSLVNMEPDNMTFVELDELDELEEPFKEGDYDPLLNDNYKLLIFDLQVFNKSLEEGITFDMDDYSFFIEGEKLNESLHSEDPLGFLFDEMFDEFFQKQVESNQIPKALLEDETMKAKLKEEFFEQAMSENGKMTPGQERSMIFAMLIKSKLMDSKDLAGLYSGFKEGSIQVYKETPLFKLFKFTPDFIFEKLLLKFAGNNEDES